MTAAEAIAILRDVARGGYTPGESLHNAINQVIPTLKAHEREIASFRGQTFGPTEEETRLRKALRALVTAAERAFDWRKDGEMHRRIEEAKEALG